MAFGRIGAVGQGSPTNATLARMVAQTTGPNTLKPQGVPPGYDWYNQGRISTGINPLPGYDWFNAWTQSYVVKDVPFNSNVLIKQRNLGLYTLSSLTSAWTRIQLVAKPTGALYPQDFVGGTIPLTRFSSVSTSLLSQASATRTLHTYPATVRNPVPANLAGIIVVCEFRIEACNGADITDSAANQYIISMGADYWTDPSVGVNTDCMVGSFTALTTSWQPYYATTMSLAQLQIYRPPAELEYFIEAPFRGLDPEIDTPCPP